MDWSCFYFARDGNEPPQVACGRESTLSGVRLTLDGQRVEVVRMSTAVDKRGFPKSYRRLLVAPRNP
jgi:hypothetical protein